MSSSVTLSQDSASSSPGVNLKWVYAAVGTVKEVSLIYFKNTSDADIISMDVPSGLLREVECYVEYQRYETKQASYKTCSLSVALHVGIHSAGGYEYNPMGKQEKNFV